MDGFCLEPSEENNHKEHTSRKRRSSILKPPRSPLQDIRSRNEIGQDFITTRSRKSSRRVSFAETIKVFQTEVPTEVKEEPKNTGLAVEEKVPFKQAKRTEDNQCEIIGMETLLRAPIQVQLQQPEDSDMEPIHEKKCGNDQTVIFSDENQMDLTASHTVMITKDLFSCPEMGKPSKIDTKSFLTNLKSHTEDVTMNKEFNLSTDPETIADKCSFQSKTSTSSEKKVNFNDFIKRLKLEKSISSYTEGPDKENVFIAHVPSQGPNNDAFSLPKKYVFPNAEENSLGVTRLFREQGDGKDITQCHRDNIQSTDPIARETLLRPAEGCDFTVYGNDFMDLTVNHTAQIFLPTNNVSGIENHIQSVTVDVTKGDYTTKNPGSKRICRNQQNVLCQDPSGNLEDKIDITRSHSRMTDTPPASQASNQGSVTLALAPESTCPGPVFQGDKTIFFSSCDDAMEMTKSLIPKGDDKNARVSNLTQMYSNPEKAISNLMDKTVYSEEDDMDITKSNTVAIHDQIIKLSPTNVQGSSVPNLENELLLQDQETVSENIKQNKSCSPVSYVTAGRLLQSLANPLSVPLSGNKSVVFSGEDMDLTKCCTVKIDSSDLGTQLPLTSANLLAPVKTKKPLSHSSRHSSGLEIWEEMEITKSHTVPIHLHDSALVTQRKLGPKNTQTETCIKDKKILELSSYPDNDILHSSVYKIDMTKSHTIDICDENLERKVALGNNGNAHFHKQSWLSNVKPITVSSEDDMERHTIDINTYALKSTLGQNSRLSDPLKKHVANTSLAFCHDKTLMFTEQQNMDLTTSHTAVIGCMSCPSIQESGDMVPQNIIFKPQSELQNNATLLSNSSVMDFVRNNTAVIQMGKPCKIDSKSFLTNLKSHTEDVTMNKEFNLSTDPETIADKCSFQSKTSTSSEKKVNFNDFIKRLKLEKSISSCTEGPDKENVFIAHVPSQGPNNDAFSLPKKYVFPNAEENSLGVTRLFREQGDGKDITQCHRDNIQSTDPIARETLLRPAEGCDFTVYGNDFMDLTVNHTAQIFLPTNNVSGIENHIQSVTVDVTKGDYTTKNPGSKRICRNQQNVLCQDPSGNLEDKIDITRSHSRMTDTPPASQASNQGSVTLALAPESTCPGPVFQGDKTIFFSSCDDAMEMTKSLIPKGDDKNARVSNLTQMYSNPEKAISNLMDKTVYSEEDDMDITKSNTVAIHDQIIKLSPTNVQGSSVPNLENELLLQDQETVSENIKQNKSCSPVSYVTAGRLLQSLANPLSVPLSGNKSVVFSGEDMDLAKCCTVKIDSSDLGTQLPLTSANMLAPVKTKNPLSPSGRPTSQIVLQQIPFPLKEAFNSFSQDKGDLQSEKPFGNCQNSLSQPENLTVANTDVSPEYAHQSLLATKLVSTNSLLPYPSEKTIIFAPEQDNMDLTENHEVIIQTGNSEILADEQQKQKYSEASMRYEKSPSLTLSCLNKKGMTEILGDSLEINKFHTIAGDKADLEEGASRATNKTVVFVNNQDELEITKSHTVLIDYQTMEKRQGRSHLTDSRRKSLGQAKMMFAPNDKTVFFSEEGGNDLDLTKSHTTIINSQTVPQGDGHRSIPVDKTIMFTSNNDMELTKPVPCMTDRTVERSRLENAQLLDKPGGSKSMNELYSNKTVVFPAGDENNMEITSAPTKEINHKDVLKSEQDSCLAPLASAFKTVLYRGEQDDMEITDLTKSHIFAMDCEANLQDAGTSSKMDKTVVFADDQNELEITKSHTVVIDYQTTEKMQSSSHLTDSRRKSLGQPKMMFAPNDQTVFFSEEGENDLDLTKSHTTVINSQTVPQGDGHRSIPVDKTIMFTSNNDMELTKPVPCMTDRTVERSRLENAQLLDKSGGSKSMNELYSNKTVVFPAGDENNMEITSAPTKEINHKDVLKSEQDSCLAPLASAFKTVLYRGEQDDMEITDLTKSHIFAMDCEANLQDAGTSSKMDKTVVFADNQNELEITKSHTVVIDYQTTEKMQSSSHLTDSRRKSLGQPKMMFAPNDQTVFFSEEGENDLDLTKSHATIINSQTVPQGDGHRSIPVDKTIMFTSNNDMELTKPVPCMTDRTVERSRLENAQLLDKPGGSKSMNELYSNKTVAFPAGDENNMEITSAPTKEINHKDVLKSEQDSCLAPLASAFKTVLYRGEQDDMEITDLTKSHIFAMDCEASLQDAGTSSKMDKTVVFADNQNELEITKSHTVVIDYQTMEKMQSGSHLTDSRRKSLGQAKMMFAPNDQTVFFLEECGNDLDLTKSHTTVINSQTVPQGDGHRSFPVDKTIMFTSNTDMELTKPVPCMTDRTVERSRLENAQLLDKPGGSKSMNELYSNKTVVFPAGDENNMEITSAPTKEINHKDVLEGEQDSCRKMNKTVVFEDNQNELEITKSHTVVIDYQTMEKTQSMFPDKAKIDSFKRNSLVGALVPNNETVFLSDEDVNDRKVTKKQIDAIENRSFLQAEQHCAFSFFPADKTIMFTGDQDAMEIDRSQSTVINEKTLEKVVDHMVKKEVCSFDSTVLLGKRTKSNSKTIPFKFPKHQVKAFIDDREQRQRSELFRDTVFVDSQPQLPTHSIPLPEKEQHSVNEVKLMQPEAENGNLEVATGNLCALNYENKSKMLHDDRELIPASEKKPKQNILISEWGTTMEIQVNSDSATEIDQLHATYSKLSDPVISSKVINTANIEQNLNTIKRSEIFSQSQISQIANLTEQLPKLGKQVGDSMDKSQMTETQNAEIGTNNTKNIEDEGITYSSNGDATYSVPLKTVVKDTIKAKRYSLGIFLPKLPNKRNCSVTGMDALEHNSVDLTDLNSSEIQPVNKKNSDLMSALTESHLSPSQYINEEHLPLDPEESNSSESISIETKGKALVETCQQETQPPESIVKEIFSTQKRLLLQGEDDSIPSEKKVQKDETSLSDSAQAPQAFDHHTEEYVDKNPCSSLMKTLNRTPPSCSSSSDSIKTDGTSMSYSMQQSSQMESQFLMDHICEENLKEKLHDGRITVREFLSLLQVHILIQKPRQSNLPANFATNVPSTPKDLMLSQYVYWPKIQIYKEDCQALHQKTEELKLHALKQDKLLVDVNRSLWEVMKGCSDEELKTFGAHLNKMKSRFAKKTKVFAHQGKAVLYSKLVQSAKDELEKLQTRMGKMDSVLTEVDTCLAALDLEIKNLDKNEEDIPVVEWDSEMLATEKELEQLQAEEEELKRNISELEIQREQVLAQVNSLQQEASRTKECLEKFSYSEWEIIEWSDSQAVFTFLYDSIELTITFGEPVDGLPFLSKACRRIIDINFKTLLHENKAPPSSLLVHRLIFQFIEDQGSWKNKCITQHHVPKMLQEISLVVSRCKLLGEEIEFLNRWGPNYNLMNVDVNNTEVKFLFSSSAAFAKFELTLTLSAHYPSVPLSFTIQNLIGNIAQDKIAAILSNVPLDNNYLKTVVRCIYQDLLQGPHLPH